MRPRRAGKERSWRDTAAAFAAGVAATLFFLWLHQNHSAALASLPHGKAGSVNGSWDAAVHEPTGGAAGAGSAGEGAADDASGSNSTLAAAAPAPAAHFTPAPLPDLDSIPYLHISFGNAAYFELAHNWARSVRATGAPFLIAAFDDSMLEMCAEAGLPCKQVVFQHANGTDFRQDFTAFRAMGAVKVRFALGLLEAHPSLPLLVVSDTDTVWLRPPWPYFEQRASAEFFISTDCLSHELEVAWDPKNFQPRCGHIPGQEPGGRAFNTGLFAARNTDASRAALRAWADMLVDPSKERADDPMHRGIDDQLAMNQLLERGGLNSVSAEDPRTVLAFDGKLRLQALPVALFSNGHVAFVQRTPWKLGVAPYVIHATFQRHNLPGKKSRMREFHLWFMDPPEYYGAPSIDYSSSSDGRSSSGGGSATGAVAAAAAAGTSAAAGATAAAAAVAVAGARYVPQEPALRLLGYDNAVLAFVDRMEAERYGSKGQRMPLFEKNWLGMSFQLAALRDAMAAARMLGRTLLLPQLWCWCDQDEHPHILFRCRIKGTDYMTPFECPLDFLLHPDALDGNAVPYRHAGFLNHPQVPLTLRHSRTVVTIAEQAPAQPFPQANTLVGHSLTVWPGILSQELARVAQPAQASAVLELRGRVPGFLGGWSAGEEAQARAFDDVFDRVAAHAKWGWFTWGIQDWEYGELEYARPRPLAEAWQAWQPPVLEMPAWCGNVSDTDGNSGFLLLPQHPCNFLKNATAAQLAADDSGQYNNIDKAVWNPP